MDDMFTCSGCIVLFYTCIKLVATPAPTGYLLSMYPVGRRYNYSINRAAIGTATLISPRRALNSSWRIDTRMPEFGPPQPPTWCRRSNLAPNVWSEVDAGGPPVVNVLFFIVLMPVSDIEQAFLPET